MGFFRFPQKVSVPEFKGIQCDGSDRSICKGSICISPADMMKLFGSGKYQSEQANYYFSSQKGNNNYRAFTFVFAEDMGSGKLMWVNFDRNMKIIDEMMISEGSCETGLCEDTYTIFKNDSDALVITVKLYDSEGVDTGDKVVDSITRKIDSTIEKVTFRYNGKIQKTGSETFHNEYWISNKENVDVIGYPAPRVLKRTDD